MAGVCTNYIIGVSFFGFFFMLVLSGFIYLKYEVLHLKDNHKTIALASLITAVLYLILAICLLFFCNRKKKKLGSQINEKYRRLNEDENSGGDSNVSRSSASIIN